MTQQSYAASLSGASERRAAAVAGSDDGETDDSAAPRSVGAPATVPSDAALIWEFPPSVKLVVKVLEYHDRLSQQAIMDRTKLPGRTVRHALAQLDDYDAVQVTQDVTGDARQKIYTLQPNVVYQPVDTAAESSDRSNDEPTSE